MPTTVIGIEASTPPMRKTMPLSTPIAMTAAMRQPGIFASVWWCSIPVGEAPISIPPEGIGTGRRPEESIGRTDSASASQVVALDDALGVPRLRPAEFVEHAREHERRDPPHHPAAHRERRPTERLPVDDVL